MNDPDWRELAVCKTVDPELWWPEGGGDNRVAKAICRSCPACTECLQHALDNEESGGIWGGTSSLERAKMRRAKRKADGGIRCIICDTLFPGSPQHRYCSATCHLEGRRRLATRRYRQGA